MTATAAPSRATGTIRNSRLAIGALLISAVVSVIAAPCFGILALTEVFPLANFRLDRVIGVIAWAAAAQGTFVLGLSLWRRTRRLAGNSITLTPEGVHFRFASMSGPVDTLMPWNSLHRIVRQRRANLQTWSFFADGGQVVMISSLSFLRVTTVARRIAAAAGIAESRQ
ncbi:MAG: hypothetical protein ABJD11_16915 [Gemmatimonadota bacterium]